MAQKPQLPPLNLLNYKILDFSWQTNLACKDSDSPLKTVQTEVLTRFKADDPLSFLVTLTIASKRGQPYKFKINLVGFFKIRPDVPEEERGRIAAVNGASMLYGSAREFIFMATSHGVHGTVLLPTISFLGLVPKEES